MTELKGLRVHSCLFELRVSFLIIRDGDSNFRPLLILVDVLVEVTFTIFLYRNKNKYKYKITS